MVEWRDCPGYPRYSASSEGQVRGRSGQVMKGTLNEATGYVQVTVVVGRKGRKIAIHRLVCEAFHGPQPDGHEVAHNNGDKLDNRSSNLRWATPKQNMEDKRKHGTARGRFSARVSHGRGVGVVLAS